ncbi:MAG: type II toxin-antitoxin system HicA family toxin [Clostridiales Family XIII bacterium]|jgi:predicted RNA binding protein YcfA (HicA-like mRNA interferase family)|nr:type II toxin-antitoxin system HicA family toxin [Clostridiales Family XIII bacterium]
MSRLKLIDAKRLEMLLFGLGFKKIRRKGSHAFYRHPDGRTTTIPFHISKDLSRPILRTILNEIKLSVDEYNELTQ